MTPSVGRASSVQTATRTVAAAGAEFVYRDLGVGDGVPLVALTHLCANLDSWDTTESGKPVGTSATVCHVKEVVAVGADLAW